MIENRFNQRFLFKALTRTAPRRWVFWSGLYGTALDIDPDTASLATSANYSAPGSGPVYEGDIVTAAGASFPIFGTVVFDPLELQFLIADIEDPGCLYPMSNEYQYTRRGNIHEQEKPAAASTRKRP